MDQTQKTVALFDTHAQQYATQYMDISLYHDGLDFLCAQLTKGQTDVLELTCGPGNITRYLLDKRPDFKLLATDLAPNMLNLARNHNPEADFQLIDCRDVLELKQEFDAIVCGFGLPYLTPEETALFIQHSAQKLRKKGWVYLSTMEGVPYHNKWQTSSQGDRLLTHYHAFTFLTNSLNANGFAIHYENRKTYTDKNNQEVTDLILIAQVE